MTAEMQELIREYIRENLSVRIDVGRDWGWHGYRIRVDIKLDGEVISTTEDSLPIKED
jgi:hypothetical protein